MTEYELKVPGQLLSSLLSDKNGLAELLEAILNPILEAQAVEQLGAERYERSEERKGYRNRLATSGYDSLGLFMIAPVCSPSVGRCARLTSHL